MAMRFLHRLFGGSANTVSDPVFGDLVLSKSDRGDGPWNGRMNWPHSPTPFAISVHRKPGPPTDGDRLVFRSLQAIYPSITPALQAALLKLWTPVAGTLDLPAPAPTSAPGLWSKLQLQGVWIAADGRTELCYGFAEDRWPDAMFVVSVLGREVRPERFEE